MREILDDTFKVFKDHVLSFRKDKIKEDCYDRVFNADVFLGDEAKNNGLIDEFGNLE